MTRRVNEMIAVADEFSVAEQGLIENDSGGLIEQDALDEDEIEIDDEWSNWGNK